MILAAGRGSRMRSLTEEQPKCLTVLGGRTLLDWQIAALRAAGVERIAVVRGYRGAMLDGAGCETFENPRWAETNMVMSLACAEPWLAEAPCLVSYSDIVYHPAGVRALIACPEPLAVTYDTRWRSLWEQRFENPLADAETFRLTPDGRLAEIGSRAQSLDDIGGQYMGLLKFEPPAWAAVRALLDEMPSEARDRLDMTSLLQRLLRTGMPIGACPVEGRWCEVDSDRDLALYDALLGGAWAHDWRWC